MRECVCMGNSHNCYRKINSNVAIKPSLEDDSGFRHGFEDKYH